MGVEGSGVRRPRFNTFNSKRANDFRLVTLGRLSLECIQGEVGEDLAGLNARRRKVAVLAVLALSPRGVSRDALVEMFWGDQDESRARHSLSDAISHLRRVLGRESIVATRSTVLLTPSAQVTVDAVELLATATAITDHNAEYERGADERLLALYGGPFLDGVHIEGSASFDHWMTCERARLERSFCRAAATCCARLAEASEWSARQAVAERWLDAEPLSGEAAVAYLESLTAAGEGDARVLAAYERLCARLRREYELEPDPAVAAIAARIAAERRTRAVPPRIARRSIVEASIPADRTELPRPRIATAFLTIVLITAAFVAGAARSTSVISPSPTSAVVAIAAIEPAGRDTSLAWLADGLPQMIAAKLSRSADVEVVPPAQIRAVRVRAGDARRSLTARELVDLGRRVGATVVVSGGVTRVGASAVLDLDVRELPAGRVRRVHVAVERDILSLVDRAAVQLLGTIGSTGSGPTLADLETPSIAAYQHFTRYAQVASEGRMADALPELDAAIAIDSGFTGALLARLIHAFQVNDGPVVASLNEALRKRGNRVPERDRLEWEAWLAHVTGEGERAVRLARVLVSRFPRDTRGYVLLADLYASVGRWADHAHVLDRLLALDSLGMEAGQGPCAPCSAFDGLVNARLVLGDNAGAERAARRWLALVPDTPVAWAYLARVLAYDRRFEEALVAMRHAVTLTNNDPETARQLGWILVMARRLEAADSLVADWEASGVHALRRHAADLEVIVQRERGQFRASNRAIVRAIEVFPELSFLELVRANGLARVGEYEAARRLYEAFHPFGNRPESAYRGGDARTFAWHHALLADALASRFDGRTLSALADSIQRIGARSYYGRDWRLHHHVRGLIAVRTGDLDRAEREFQAARWVPAGGWTRTALELGKVQLARGRPLESIATFRTAYAVHPDAMGRYLPRSEIDFWMGTAFRRAGQSDSALVYEGHARRAWAGADPEIRSLLTTPSVAVP